MIGLFPATSNRRQLAIPLVGIALLLFASGQSKAQPSATAAALHEADHQAGLGRWVDAIEIYQRILESGGDDLVPADRPIAQLASLAGGAAWSIPWPSYHFRPARRICHERISRFPPDALKAYRDRVDRAAEKRLGEARKRAADDLLERIVGDWFCSRHGEEAIRLLGERAFERADLDAAERWWTMLLPRDPDNPAALRYPNPVTPAAAVHARLLLIKLFRGERDDVRRELKAYRAAYSDASGLLAGRHGKYAETLEQLLANPTQASLREDSGNARMWATFAGFPERTNQATSGLPKYWPGPPSWRTSIPAEASGRSAEEAPGPPDHPRALAFQPVIANGRVFVADAARVFSFDLMTGERTTLFDLRKHIPVSGIDLRLPARIDARYTLAFADGFLYVRLGAQRLRTIRDDVERAAPSAIVCLGPIAPQSREALAVRWILQPHNAQCIFEGTPVIHDGRLYVLVLRFAGGAPIRLIACYRGLGRGEPPELVWERETGRAPRPATNDMSTRHELLTLAGKNVVFGSGGGSIIAVDGRSGNPAWEYRYTLAERRLPPIGRDLTPCLFDGFRVFAAPADSDRLFCLDAFSGRLLWDREGVDVVHLLGVTHGKLIATFAGPMKGIRGLNVTTGAETRPGGWTQHAEGGLASFGRGFVTPDLIFWPTKHGLYFLDPEDGSPARQPIEGSFGNLVYADGCFVVTRATEVIGFFGDGKRVEPRRKEAPKPPAKILIYREPGGDADANNLPALALPLHRDAQIEFARTQWQPLATIPSRGDESANRESIWFTRFSPNQKHSDDRHFQELACAHQVGCGAAWDDTLLLAGANGATRLKLNDVEPKWSWHWPINRDANLLREPRDAKSGRFSSWHRSGSRLYVVRNDSQLLALDAESGAVIWRHHADDIGGTLPPTTIRPHFFAGKQRLLLQLSSGRLRIVDAKDGRILDELPTSRAPWAADPVRLSASDERIVLTEDADAMACFDLNAGRFVWRTPTPRPASLTGHPPSMRGLTNVLLVEIERNIGVEIEAFDPTDGRQLWKAPIFVGSRTHSLRDAGCDGKRLYLPGESAIIAVSLMRGERLWEAPLPAPNGGPLRILCAQKHLIVYPIEATPIKTAEREWARIEPGWPSLARLARLAEKSYDAFMNRTLPVAVLNSNNGKLLQRLSFPAFGPDCTIQLRSDSSATVSTGSGIWRLSGESR